MATADEVKTAIKNNALLHIGSKTVTNFETSTTERAEVCNALYPSLKTKLISLRSWTFAFKKAQLTGKTELTGEVYRYSYDIPTDLINLLRLFYSKDSPVSMYHYQIREGKIFTNFDNIYAEYVYNVTEDKYTPVFINFFEYALAEELAFKLTGDKNLQDRLHIKAWGPPSDNYKGGLFGFASLTDQKQQPTTIIQDSPLILARNQGVK